MTLPNFLVIEVRAAFRAAARQHQASKVYSRTFCNARVLHHDSTKPKDGLSRRSPARPPVPSQHRAPTSSTEAASLSESTELTPQEEKHTALDTARRVPVPHRVIPKAELTPDVRLTPRERLHIEVLTRQQPRRGEDKKTIFRERLQIYHMGSFKENLFVWAKVTAITCACVVNFIIVPAHLSAGTDWWIVALIWLGGFVPGLFMHYSTKPMVSRMFINLPVKARESSKAAMEYAKNLPGDAEIDIRYLKPWGLEGAVKARVNDFVPAKGNLLRPLSFKWVNRKPSSRYVPDGFYVDEKTATGKQSTNTIPGIWETIYRHLMKTTGQASMARYEKSPRGWQGD